VRTVAVAAGPCSAVPSRSRPRPSAHGDELGCGPAESGLRLVYGGARTGFTGAFLGGSGPAGSAGGGRRSL